MCGSLTIPDEFHRFCLHRLCVCVSLALILLLILCFIMDKHCMLFIIRTLHTSSLLVTLVIYIYIFVLCCVCLFLPFFVLSFANLHQNFWFFHNWWIFVVRYLHVDILLVVSLTENRLSVLFRLSWHNWIWTGKKFGHYYWHSSTHNTQHTIHLLMTDVWCACSLIHNTHWMDCTFVDCS